MYKIKQIAINKLLEGESFGYWRFDKWRDDKDVVRIAVRMAGYALQDASDRLRDDREIVLETIKYHPTEYWGLQFASPRLQNDKEICLHAYLSEQVYFFEYASQEIIDFCRGKDVAETLAGAIEKEKLYKNLQKQLAKKGTLHQNKSKVKKI